ncbi:Kexin [Candida viswanathii]|uniref:Kexin n=1 Tax=Candida viswanathii TaxID=5486 RepID=A0A367YCE5_9ASCO|nr:Kexin [Candida viswanathii]
MLPIKLLLLILGYLLSPALQQELPPRDYENKNYFLVELNTTDTQKPLIDFIQKYKDHYSFEYQLPALDNHYVFSVDKRHAHNSFLGNHNSNSYNLMKREVGYEDHYDDLTANVQAIHMLPPKKLSKRMPVPIHDEDRQDFVAVDSRDDNSDNDATNKAHQKLAQIASKLDIHDPEFTSQWHLINLKYPGHDVNATGLWLEDILGQGIVTALVDDGVDAEGADLKDNFNADGSWDFNNNGKSPMPRLYDDYHGTRCAGEIAAVKNDVCGIGVAWKSQVSGIRILSGPITSADEASAMIYGLEHNDIYSCSWGPTDNGRVLSEPEVIVKKAMIKGIQEGRDKKGALYVFASGNGGRFGDSCNFDGYTNSIYSITVGAIDYKGLHPEYSEACSAVMVVTYSSGSGEHIHTTDIKKKCSSTHGGTSAAAPLASGIYSLVLGANPDLTWRDVQYISVLSATPINEDDGNYQVTALNRKYSHKYGYGKTDAYKMVHFAKNWKNVKPQAWYYSDITEVNDSIKTAEDKTKVIKSSITVTEDDLKVMNVERVEHITVKVNIEASYRGRVGMRIISPTGVISDLAAFRRSDASGKGFQNWTFMSVAHWGESGLGEWKVEVFADDSHGDNVIINFKDWQFRIFGESIDADKAETYDLEKDYAAVRRDLLEHQNEPETSSAPAAETQTSLSQANEETSGAVETSVAGPASSKENEAKSETSEGSDETATPATSEESKPSETHSDSESDSDSDDDGQNKGSGEGEAEDSDEDEGDDEGGDDKTQVKSSDHTGIYFMSIAVVGFIAVLLLMKFHKTPGSGRRRRRRDEYEFDIIPGEDYSDSDEDEEHDRDSFDLGNRNDQRLQGPGQRDYDRRDDEARDRLFDEFNAESLPDYESDMFKIGDEDEDDQDGGAQSSAKASVDTTKTKVDQKRGDDDDGAAVAGEDSKK